MRLCITKSPYSWAGTQIEKAGYTGVRGLQRTPDGVWHAAARDSRNASGAVALDSQGRLRRPDDRSILSP
ncbi:MAG: hypothetical protein GEV13_26170 [Rhodospirillales bacterium]|nr:hypothetical protein [Rhodospirillales bacterium]